MIIIWRPRILAFILSKVFREIVHYVCAFVGSCPLCCFVIIIYSFFFFFVISMFNFLSLRFLFYLSFYFILRLVNISNEWLLQESGILTVIIIPSRIYTHPIIFVGILIPLKFHTLRFGLESLEGQLINLGEISFVLILNITPFHNYCYVFVLIEICNL